MFRYLALLSLLVPPAAAQLTVEQRLADFHNLADLYARRYAALEWKKAAVGFDALNVAPWLDRVRAAKTDLEFYDLLVEYVSDLKDAHDQYLLPTDFEAYLPFTVDVYEGKVLIDSLNRKLLPHATYFFDVGDELVSVDGKPVADWIAHLSKYVSAGISRARERQAAELITDRYQAYYPWAAGVGETAAVVIKLASGEQASFDVRWYKSGTPLVELGSSPNTVSSVGRTRGAKPRAARTRHEEFLDRFARYRLPARPKVAGFGDLAPAFTLPADFTQRLGGKSYDSYYSGSFQAEDGTRIGYLRVPDFEYPSMTSLDKEIAYFQDNTDVLVVDVSRNPGGNVCSAEKILSRLSPRSFQGASAETRVTWWDIVDVNSALEDAISYHAVDVVPQLEMMQKEYADAFRNAQGRTRAMPICAADATRAPNATGYSKPVLVIVDEFSASSADIFAAMVQDNGIGTLFGYRTMGAGGSPEEDFAGVYSEGSTTLTRSLVVRQNPVVTSDFPTSPYVENVGVRPEIAADYMTRENLLNQGAAFVKAFTAAAVQLAKGK